MTRKFKTAGALVALVVMFALTASAAQATFTSAAYPATASGTSTADKFDMFGSTVSCTNNTFTATVSAASTTLTVSPSYKSCSAFGVPATMNTTGCDFLFHNAASSTDVTTGLACPAGVLGIDITMFSSTTHVTPICHVIITPYTGRNGLQAHNAPGGDYVITGIHSGLNAHQERTNFLCPGGTEDKAAQYTVQAAGITMTGNNGAVSVS